MTLKQIEKILVTHLQESGEIRQELARNRSDLAWLKKAHWIQFTGVITLIVTAFAAILVRSH